MEVPGLLHKNVLEAAEVDRKPIPWCVQADATPGSAGRLAEVKGLMTSCLSLSPEERPKLPDLHRSVTVLQAAEAAEARAAGSTGHGRPATVLTASREWVGRHYFFLLPSIVHSFFGWDSESSMLPQRCPAHARCTPFLYCVASGPAP
jgi:hypothetical protein